MIALAALGALGAKVLLPRSHMLFPPRAANGVEYVLYVHVPKACRAGGCEALYLMDGAAWLPTFADIVEARTRRGEMAPIVLVGVGYRDIIHTRARRKRDFTPAFGRTPGETGGADAYLDVLRDELVPYAELHLPIARDRRGFAGHSYAGLFGAYVLAREPALFDRYLIMSPALWFDNEKIYAEAFAGAVRETDVFLAADTPRGASSGMANDVARLHSLLVQAPNVRASLVLQEGETHNSMVAPAARAGLVALFQ